MFSLDPSLIIAAGASFVAGVMGYIIARLWVKPIVRYNITKRRLDVELTRCLDLMNDTPDGAGPVPDASGGAQPLREARKLAMELQSCYSNGIPYWYRLLLESRQESPVQVSGRLTNLNKIPDLQTRRERIQSVRKELCLDGKKKTR